MRCTQHTRNGHRCTRNALKPELEKKRVAKILIADWCLLHPVGRGRLDL